jgi:Xaa-Pro aminopeptidase
MDFVADILKAKGWDEVHLGVEMDSYYYSAAAHAALQHGLPNARLKDAHSLVNWVRSIKSPAELSFMHQAARIVEQTMQRGIDMIEPGVRQCDVVGEIYKSAISGTPEFGGDYAAIVPLLPTGPGTSTPHLTWTDQPFRRNEATILELAGCRRRYHCPMARTVFLGDEPPVMLEAAKIIVDGIAAALEAARPGNTCEQVEAAWREVISRHGLTKESRIGYSTGLNYPPDWGEHTMSLRPGDDTEIRPNMTFHLIPGIWADGWGIEISECFRVTEKEAETFCSFPRELIVKN